MDQKETMTDLEIRKRRLLYQAGHRGSYEADLMIGGFVKRHIYKMETSELDELEHIMGFNDTDLALWLTGFKPIPSELKCAMMKRMCDFAKNLSAVKG